MNKPALIRKIIADLNARLALHAKAARTARSEATDEELKAEDKYDTRGLEASYLAHGQSRQALETKAAITAFEAKNPGVKVKGVYDNGGIIIKRLTEKGVLQQWFQLHHLSQQDILSIIETARSEFTL